jgi:hypothetical protein
MTRRAAQQRTVAPPNARRIALVTAGEAGRTSQQEGQTDMKRDTRRLSKIGGAALAALLALLGLALTQWMLAERSALADSCPNAAERFGASANLPDCRAYELVTPPVKEDNSNLFNAYGFGDGEHVVYEGIAPFPGAENGGGNPALSYRTPEGWKTRSLTPPQGPGEPDTLFNPDQGDALFMGAFTSDFSTAFVDTTFASDPLDQNLSHDVYRIDVASGASSLASLPDTGPMTESIYHPPGGNAGEVPGSILAGASSDGSRVYYTDIVNLPTAPGTPAETSPVGVELYERHDDHTYLVGVLPDGSIPSCGAELGQGGMSNVDTYQKYFYGAIAPDGSNVVFHTPALHFPGETPGCGTYLYPQSEGALYLREDNGTPQARTVKLPGIVYLGRTADATKIFSGGDLEGDAEGGPLYEYDIATEQTIKIGTGYFLASSDDGSVVYYLTGDPIDLAAGGAGQQLKVYDHGITRIVPGAGPGYAGKALENGGNLLGFLALENLPVTTPDGSKLLFLDRANLTAYNSAGPGCAALNSGRKPSTTYLLANCDEAYIYDLSTGSLTCVSCNPDGTPPSGETTLFIPGEYYLQSPQWTYSLSQDGTRAFFETENSLVPQDTNGQSDVYEWENGHIYLISSGQGSQGSRIDGVSSNGDDVFFQTGDGLLPQDVESATQIYDARVGGGFPYTTPVYGCDSGQCQGPQTPAPVFSPPASATFAGVGNPPAQSTGTTPPKSAKSKKKKKKAKPKRRARRTAKKGKSKRRSHNRDGKGRK